MAAFWIGVVLLTIINAGILYAIKREMTFDFRLWRVSLALAPTPMLGVAGSYGVYAYNLMFMPWWAAVLMAAAYEVTYIGLAALDNLTPEQRDRAHTVAKQAAWVSFFQNAMAGLLYAMPDILAAAHDIGNSAYSRLMFWAPLAVIHGALVYVGFTTAQLTLHRPDAQAVVLPKLGPQPFYPAPEPLPPPPAGAEIDAALDVGEPIDQPIDQPAADTTPSPAPEPITFNLADLLAAAGLDAARARAMLASRGLTTADAAYALLNRYGLLPHGMTLADFRPLFAELAAADQPTAPSEPINQPAADADYDTLRAYVLDAVDNRNMTQAAVARELGRSRQWIGDLYHNRGRHKRIKK